MWVLLDGKRGQFEGGSTAGEDDAGAFTLDRDRLGRQGTRDISKEATGDQDCALIGHIGIDGDFSGDLVVEGTQGDGVTTRGEDESGENGHRWPARQSSRSPLHGVGENVTLDAKLHDSSRWLSAT